MLSVKWEIMSNQIASNAAGVGLQWKGIRSFPSKEALTPFGPDQDWTKLKLREIEEYGQGD